MQLTKGSLIRHPVVKKEETLSHYVVICTWSTIKAYHQDVTSAQMASMVIIAWTKVEKNANHKSIEGDKK